MYYCCSPLLDENRSNIGSTMRHSTQHTFTPIRASTRAVHMKGSRGNIHTHPLVDHIHTPHATPTLQGRVYDIESSIYARLSTPGSTPTQSIATYWYTNCLKHTKRTTYMELLLFSLPRLLSLGGREPSLDSLPAPSMRASSRLSFLRVFESFPTMGGKFSLGIPANSISLPP